MTPVSTVKIGDEDFLAAAGPLPGNLTKSKSGYVVLASLTAARAGLSGVEFLVIVLGLIGMLVAIGAAVLTAMRFLQPLDRIETGVAEVINGNRDYSFDSPSKDFEGLANGLNVMLARLLGRPDPSDDELGSPDDGSGQAWGGELSVADATGPQTSPEVQALADEPEDAVHQAHVRRVHRGAQADQRRQRRADARRLRHEAQAERGSAEEEARSAHGALQGRHQERADDAQAVPDPVTALFASVGFQVPLFLCTCVLGGIALWGWWRTRRDGPAAHRRRRARCAGSVTSRTCGR